MGEDRAGYETPSGAEMERLAALTHSELRRLTDAAAERDALRDWMERYVWRALVLEENTRWWLPLADVPVAELAALLGKEVPA